MAEDDLTAFANAMLSIRKSRDAFVPADMLRGEQVWNLLLILFIADGRGERLTSRMVIEQEGGSAETGRRWLKYLTGLTFIIGDGDGDLDDPLTLTAVGLHALEDWLRDSRETVASIVRTPVR